MKTIVLITTPIGEEKEIPNIKQELIKYIGLRSITDSKLNLPYIVVNTVLGVAEKQDIIKISQKLLESSHIWFIEYEHQVPIMDFIFQPKCCCK